MLIFDGEWVKEIRIEDLPKTYQELASLAGQAAVECLYPDGRPENAEDLEKTLGAFIAAKLSSYLGGAGAVYYPKLESCLRELKYRMLRADAAQAKGPDKYRMLARKYNFTEVWVRQLVDHPEDDPQLDMFASNG